MDQSQPQPPPISIHIDYDNKDYTPGETITGTVLWTPQSIGKKKKDTHIALFYKTSGRGTEEVHIVAKQSWPADAIKGTFEFTLPYEPYSFSGKLISLTWGLEAVSSSGKETTIYDLSLTPNGAPIILDVIKDKASSRSLLKK